MNAPWKETPIGNSIDIMMFTTKSIILASTLYDEAALSTCNPWYKIRIGVIDILECASIRIYMSKV